MEFVNSVYRPIQAPDGARRQTVDFAIGSLLLLLAPMAPHLRAEVGEPRHEDGTAVHDEPWPIAEPEMVRVNTVTVVWWLMTR
jgi:leucyl-tRNA synthetase